MHGYKDQGDQYRNNTLGKREFILLQIFMAVLVLLLIFLQYRVIDSIVSPAKS